MLPFRIVSASSGDCRRNLHGFLRMSASRATGQAGLTRSTQADRCAIVMILAQPSSNQSKKEPQMNTEQASQAEGDRKTLNRKTFVDRFGFGPEVRQEHSDRTAIGLGWKSLHKPAELTRSGPVTGCGVRCWLLIIETGGIPRQLTTDD